MKKFNSKLVFSMVFIIVILKADSQNTWTQKANLTAFNGRTGATGFSIGHYGFIGCGFNALGNLNDFWRWNQDSNTWTSVANYPGMGRFGIASFTIGGKAYCCAGGTGSINANDLWEFDTASNSWTQKANFPGLGRFVPFVFVLGTKAYVGCGEHGGTPYYQDVWVYDATTNVWSQAANFGGGNRAGLCFFSLNGYGYAGCGGDGINSYNDLWQYNSTTNSWSIMNSLPIPSAQLINSVSFVIDSLAYIGTGINVWMGEVYRDFWSYSATTNSYIPITTLPGVGRQGAVGFTIGNKGYTGTGEDSVGDFLEDYWEFVPTSISTGIFCSTIKVSELSLSPNPSTGIFTLAFNHSQLASASQTNIEIYNVLGEQVYFHHQIIKSSNYQIDLGSQPNGVYFYRVGNEEGMIGRGKVVIQK